VPRPVRPARGQAFALPVFAVLLWLPVCGAGQDAPGVRPLGPSVQPVAPAPTPPVAAVPLQAAITPELAAAIARNNGLDVALARVTVWRTRAALLEIDGLEDIRASASVSYSVSGSFGDEPSGDSRSGSVSLNRSLFRTPRIIATGDVAQADVARALTDEPVTVRELELAARLAVYDILRQEQLVRAASEQTRMREAHLDLTRMLRQAETVADFDVVQAETATSAAIGDEVAARSTLEQLLAALKRLLTLAQDTVLAVDPGTPPTVPGGTAQERLELACQLRPEIARALASIGQSEASVRLAATTSDWTTGLSGSLSQSPLLDGSAKLRWRVGASGSKALLDGDAQVTAEAQAAARLQATELELEALRHDIALELAQADLALQDAWERLNVAEAGIREARETLAIAQVRYEVQYGTGIEVLDAQTALTVLEIEAINAQFDIYSAITRLRYALGLDGRPE